MKSRQVKKWMMFCMQLITCMNFKSLTEISNLRILSCQTVSVNCAILVGLLFAIIEELLYVEPLITPHLRFYKGKSTASRLICGVLAFFAINYWSEKLLSIMLVESRQCRKLLRPIRAI